MFPKTGNVFPSAGSETRPESNYREAIATALRSELGETHRAVKQAMRWTGASERTAKNWIAGSHGPSGENLVSLIRHSDAVLMSLIVMAGRDDAIVAFRLTELHERLEEIRLLIETMLGRGEDQES